MHRRHGWRRPPVLALAAVVVVALGGVVGVRVLSGCRAVEVVVAADAAVAAPVRQVLQAEQAGCAEFRVIDAPATLVTDIQAGAVGLPAVWIPDSTLALDTLDTTSGTVVDQGASLASSPVVLVLPEADDERYGDPTRALTWDAVLAHPRPPALPDPTLDRSGLAALTALRIAVGDDAGRPRPAFVAAVLAMANGSLPSPAAGYAGVERDAGGTGDLVTGFAPAGATAALDFPFVRIRAGAPGDLDGRVDELEELLRGPAGRAVFGAAGLRAPDGARIPAPDAAPADTGWLDAQVATAAPPARPLALETLRLWTLLTQQSRLLTVIDVSGSMAAEAGDSDRITLAARAAQSALTLFPDTSSAGLWAFSARPAPETSWEELVPLGPLAEPVAGSSTRRAALAAAAMALPGRVGGQTALYDTVLAATRAVRAGFDPTSSNTVVLITDGRNEVTGGIDLPGVLRTLRAEADPTRPVPVIAIGLGPEADAEALRQIAQATGGRTYLAQDPLDIRTIFLQALSQRV